MKDYKGKKVAIGETSTKDIIDREVSPPPGFPPRPKGKRVATWETSNKDDGREVSPPPGFPPRTKPRSMTEMTDKRKEKVYWNDAKSNAVISHSISAEKTKYDREVSPPPGFPPRTKPHSMTKKDKRKGKETRNDAKSKYAISPSISGDKTKSSVPVPSPLNANVKIEKEDITENEKAAAPIVIPPKRKEKLTPLAVIKRLTQKSAKQNIDPHKTVSLSTIPNKVTTNVTSAAGISLVESDKFLNSLAKLFPQRTANSLALISLLLCKGFGCSNIPRADFIFARQRLSLLLPINFHVLADPAKSKELVNLSTMLQKDTTLNADQVAMLKLIIEEIPSVSKNVLEIKELAAQVKEFLVDFKSNCFKASSLCKEYEKSKEKLRTLQAEVDVDVAALQEFEDQIIGLNARHSILVCSLEMKKKIIMELESSLKDIVSKIHKVVHDIKVANSRKEEWEEKKKLLTDRCNKIRAKFAPLNGITI